MIWYLDNAVTIVPLSEEWLQEETTINTILQLLPQVELATQGSIHTERASEYEELLSTADMLSTEVQTIVQVMQGISNDHHQILFQLLTTKAISQQESGLLSKLFPRRLARMDNPDLHLMFDIALKLVTAISAHVAPVHLTASESDSSDGPLAKRFKPDHCE